MKHPKNWNKMNLNQQEAWLVKKLQELYRMEDNIKKNLASVRGGKSVYIKEELSRPDEIILKDA